FPAGGPAPLNRLCSSHRQVCGSVKSRGVLLSYWVRLHECAYHKKRKQQISTKEKLTFFRRGIIRVIPPDLVLARPAFFMIRFTAMAICASMVLTEIFRIPATSL